MNAPTFSGSGRSFAHTNQRAKRSRSSRRDGRVLHGVGVGERGQRDALVQRDAHPFCCAPRHARSCVTPGGGAPANARRFVAMLARTLCPVNSLRCESTIARRLVRRCFRQSAAAAASRSVSTEIAGVVDDVDDDVVGDGFDSFEPLSKVSVARNDVEKIVTMRRPDDSEPIAVFREVAGVCARIRPEQRMAEIEHAHSRRLRLEVDRKVLRVAIVVHHHDVEEQHAGEEPRQLARAAGQVHRGERCVREVEVERGVPRLPVAGADDAPGRHGQAEKQAQPVADVFVRDAVRRPRAVGLEERSDLAELAAAPRLIRARRSGSACRRARPISLWSLRSRSLPAFGGNGPTTGKRRADGRILSDERGALPDRRWTRRALGAPVGRLRHLRSRRDRDVAGPAAARAVRARARPRARVRCARTGARGRPRGVLAHLPGARFSPARAGRSTATAAAANRAGLHRCAGAARLVVAAVHRGSAREPRLRAHVRTVCAHGRTGGGRGHRRSAGPGRARVPDRGKLLRDEEHAPGLPPRGPWRSTGSCARSAFPRSTASG